MNKFCGSSLCVEKVTESNVLTGRRVVVPVPGGSDAIRLGVLEILVELRLLSLWAPGSMRRVTGSHQTSQDLLEAQTLVPVTC